MLIAVYNSVENHEDYNQQANNPRKNEVVVIEQKGDYFFLPEYPKKKNGVKQVFHPARFRSPSFGEIITFSIQYDESKVTQ